jgi:hypothetical protein
MMRIWPCLLALGLALGTIACGNDTAYQTTTSPTEDAGDTTPSNNGAPDTGGSDAAEDTKDDTRPDLPVIEPDGGDPFEPACSLEDGLAPNQSPNDAAEVDSDILDNFYLCPDTSDWFVFEAVQGQTLAAWTIFNPRQGDVDIYLYEEGATGENDQIAESTSPNQQEYFEYEVTRSGRYYLEVRSFEGADLAYTQILKVQCHNDADCPDGRACHLRNRWCYPEPRDLECGIDEGYEPNESSATATPVPLGEETAVLEDISICPDDEDYYRVELGTGQGIVVQMDHSEDDDVDVLLFKANGDLISEGVDRRGGEELRGLYLEPGGYLVMVDMRNYQGARPTTYTLEISLVDGRCTADADCDGLEGREFCDLEGGTCFGINSDGEQGLFEPCDDDDDCSTDTDGCHEGTPGGGDNVCTVTCSTQRDGCADLVDGAYCLILDRLSGSGVCVPACDEDRDCATNRFCDTQSGVCQSRACGTDADCGREGEACLYSDGEWDGGLCLPYDPPDLDCGVGDAPDDTENGTSSSAAAIVLENNAAFAEGLAICDADDDWYVVELLGNASHLTVDLGFEGRADLDLYLYNEDGREMARGIEPDANPEQAVAEYIPAGRYYIRTNGYPVGEGDSEIVYNLQLNVGAADCRSLQGVCHETSPLRLTCDQDSGACEDFDGAGEVELGDACDTSDDCNEDADTCFTFFGGDGGGNICTHTCESQDDCNDVPDTRCRPIRRGLGLCIRGRP